MERIAFYGTLRQSFGVQRKLGVERWLSVLGPCVISGRSIKHLGYPGLVPGDGEVAAELYEVLDPRAFVILDDYEQFNPMDPAGSLYVRKVVGLLTPDCDAWVYFANERLRR